MNYEVFMLHNQGKFMNDRDVTPQEYMEQLFRAVLQPSENLETPRITDMLRMELVNCDEKTKSLCIGIQAENWHLNPSGMFHGGILATAVDISMGLLVRFFKKFDKVATVQLNMNYLRPVVFDDYVCICVKIDKIGAKVAFLSADVVVERTGQIVATATSVFM